MDNVENVVVDTTARCIIKMKGDHAPTVEMINKHLPRGLKAKKVTKRSVPRALEVYSIKVKGLG